MKSTSTSENHNVPILRLERVNLVFKTNFYRPATWRDYFTQASRDPIGTLAAEQDRIQVAKDISFSVYKGERVALIGVNGTGKSSLCRCIAGTYRPTSGRIFLRGQARAIFDTAIGIQPELTGRENAKLLSIFMFPDAPDRERAVEEALDFSELGKFVDMPYRMYSNGMQARLCLSLVACRPCDLFILDEVFDGADQFFREKISEKMMETMHESGAVLFVSHSADQIRRVCTRVIVLSRGLVAFDGAVNEGLEFYNEMNRNFMAGIPAVVEPGHA